MNVNFSVFIDKILSGEKRQTIRRASPKWENVKVGDKLTLYTGLRTKQCRKLGEAVLTYPTPKCQDARAVLFDRRKGNLGEVIHGRYLNGGNTTPQTQMARLNPDWVEWLMGWPIGWTDLKPLATGKFRLWRQKLLTF